MHSQCSRTFQQFSKRSCSPCLQQQEKQTAMQKWRGIRFVAISAMQSFKFPSIPYRFLHSSTYVHESLLLLRNRSMFKPSFNLVSSSWNTQSQHLDLGFRNSFMLRALMLNQMRHASSRERKRTKVTPVTSKLKKTKMKSYSSYKFRFRTMNDGLIRRWRAGKRHNAHLKSKKSKRRLRKPEIVHAAYAKVMKKLNFCG